MKEKIRTVLRHWGMEDEDITILGQAEGGRVIAKAGQMVLKGIPLGDKPERVIAGNTAAHILLGRRGIAPRLICTDDGEDYVQEDGYWWFAMAYVQGRQMEETEVDLQAIGLLARQPHSMTATWPSGLDESKQRYYAWFADKPFKAAFDALLDSLPDWSQHDRCFVHTDLGPHNSMLSLDGRAVLIDLDDAGQGSRCLDLGWPLIMEFVDLNHDTGAMRYRFDLARAYLQGYYCGGNVAREEYDLAWQGAVQMHISYMQTWGPYAVDSLWGMLQFGLAQKEKLWQTLSCGGEQSHV